MPTLRWRGWRVVFVLVTFGAAPLRPQTPPQSPGDSAAALPLPIPADSIPDHVRAAAATLSGLRARLPTDSTLARMDSTLSGLEARYAELRPRLAPDRLEAMFYDELVDLHAAVGELQQQVNGWAEDAGRRAGRVGAMRDTLRLLQARWIATRGQSRTALPAALREQVTGMLRVTDSVAAEVQPVLDRVLTAQGRGSRLAIELGARIDEVQGAQDRARRQLLRRDSRPLWNAFRPRADTTGAEPLVAEPPADRFDLAVQYLSGRLGRVQLHLALFVLVALVFWRVGGRRDQWATAEFAIHWPSNLLAHPIAASLVLSLVFMRPLYPGAPQSVYGLGFLLMLPGLIPLLRSLLPVTYRAPAYVLVALYAVRVLATTFDWSPAPARIALLALAAGGVAALAWLARVIARQGRWWRRGQVLAPTGAALLGLACVANVLGYVVLADFLLSATLTVALTALALIALADVLIGATLVVLYATPLGRLQVIGRNRDAVTRRVRSVVYVAAVLVFLTVALRQFRVLGPVVRATSAFLAAPRTIGSLGFTVGEILVFLGTLVVAVYVARGLRAVLRQDVLARMDLGRGIPEAASSIVYYVTLALGVLFAAGAAGIEVGRLAIIAGALGVGIGFGLQTVVANFMAGLILLFERPVKPGDTVELEGLGGVVQTIGIRASTVRTFQGADVIVPNQDLIAGRVINWTLSDHTRRVDVPVGAAYGTDPTLVMTTLHGVLAAHPRVLPQPPPEVLFLKFGESSLDFEARFWARLDEWMVVRSDVLIAISAAFAREGIAIPLPQRDVHLRSAEAVSPPAPPSRSS